MVETFYRLLRPIRRNEPSIEPGAAASAPGRSSICGGLSVSRWREGALRLRHPKRISKPNAIWAAFHRHHHPVNRIDFGPYTEITTRPTGPRECADAPPFVTPELRAAHRVGAPVCRRGRVHHRPYDAAHGQRSIGIDERAVYSHPRLEFSILNEFHSLKDEFS